MLVNIPSAEGLNEAALRSYFDVWKRASELYSDFAEEHNLDVLELEGEHIHKELWDEYVQDAQPEISHLVSMLLQAVELRLKSLITQVSPFLLLLNGRVKFAKNDQEIDFASLRTLDATELPSAVGALTNYELPSSFSQTFDRLRQVRNKMMHLGVHEEMFRPGELVFTLAEVYSVLWKEGAWLTNRVKYDGKSARRFFHDYRWSSPESEAMAEFPFVQGQLSNGHFKKCVGAKKASIQVFCPVCLDQTASKLGLEGAVPTAFQTSKVSANCLMCQTELTVVPEGTPCVDCMSAYAVEANTQQMKFSCCMKCGLS
jgi:hypothetical protein